MALRVTGLQAHACQKAGAVPLGTLLCVGVGIFLCRMRLENRGVMLRDDAMVELLE